MSRHVWANVGRLIPLGRQPADVSETSSGRFAGHLSIPSSCDLHAIPESNYVLICPPVSRDTVSSIRRSKRISAGQAQDVNFSVILIRSQYRPLVLKGHLSSGNVAQGFLYQML